MSNNDLKENSNKNLLLLLLGIHHWHVMQGWEGLQDVFYVCGMVFDNVRKIMTENYNRW